MASGDGRIGTIPWFGGACLPTAACMPAGMLAPSGDSAGPPRAGYRIVCQPEAPHFACSMCARMAWVSGPGSGPFRHIDSFVAVPIGGTPRYQQLPNEWDET
jgi:hypothetical protein